MDKKLIDEDGYCFYCGNSDNLKEPCPSCGRQPKKISFGLENRNPEEIKVFLNRIEKFGIPEQYKGVIWSPDMLYKYKREDAENPLFKKYVSQLEKIHGIFAGGTLPGKSAIIISPAGYSKRTFAYSCMQHAADNGFSVAPLIDTVDLKRLLVLGMDKPTYKLYGFIDYDEYLTSDVCFLEVTRLPQHEYSSAVIQEIIDKRSRLGLSVIILSNYQLSELSKRDKSSQFESIVSAGAFDDYRYPPIIKFNKLFKEG